MLDSPYFARPVHHEISLSPKNWTCFYCGSTNLFGHCEHCNAPKKEIWCVQAPRPPTSPRPQTCGGGGLVGIWEGVVETITNVMNWLAFGNMGF